MSYLPIILISSLIISLTLNFIKLSARMSAMEIVNDMGLGWNLANSFDSYNIEYKMTNPDKQITLWGNIVPRRELFVRIKKYGFKTIRFPVTWLHFIEDSGKINPEWMSRVKEVVNWIITSNMYCILNLHHDGKEGNWLSKGITAKEKYISIWEQISEEFKNYDEHLIFESMNDVIYKIGDNYDYETLLNLTQAFVDIIRNSGGNNPHRLLLISGADTNLDLTCNPEYKLPKDPKNKLAISLHYYLPSQFTLERDDDPWTWIDENGETNIIQPMTQWGSENHYKDMFTNFEKMKTYYIDKGIPIIIGEVGVLTEQKKEKESIREYLYAEFSMSAAYEGITSCLWDTSTSDINYYDRQNDKWYDEEIKNNFKKISKGKFINPKDFYIISNKDTTFSLELDGSIYMEVGSKKVVNVIFNAKINSAVLYDTGFGITSLNKNGEWCGESISGTEGKKQYDGSYTFTINMNKKDFNNHIKIERWWGQELIDLNYLTVEFEQSYTIFDYKEYKNAIKSM